MTPDSSSPGYWDGESLADYQAQLIRRRPTANSQQPTAPRPPLTALPDPEPIPGFDLQEYLDQRRDDYLSDETDRLNLVAGTTGTMSVDYFLGVIRAAYVAGASAMADGATARDSLALLHDDEKLARAERRCAMRRELRRQQRIAEVETRISRIASVIG